tara:strand:+ start:198 stop:371 length:174 start_codon:yes stop_codon:yes gene_type:complete
MKLDALLEIDCNNYANLGSDSTKAEKLEVKKQSRQIYRAIKTIDPVWGERFLRTMDK